MRYFEMDIITSAKEIEDNARIKLREYSYNNTIGAVNDFMYRTMNNGFTFFVYREEKEDLLLAAFSYDEQKYTHCDACQHIENNLKDAFCIKRFKSEPCEITMLQFCEHFQEGRRRNYIEGHINRIIDNSNLFMMAYSLNETEDLKCDFKEKIITKGTEKATIMYDEKFKNELANIERHKGSSRFVGNIVHYVISCRSADAAAEMTECLAQSLNSANRIKSRRVGFISEIDPFLYKADNLIEKVIENNFGGAVVIDLTEKFGFDPADYKTTCDYIEKLVKKHRNNCLFIFTYNMEHPGFSYFILPSLRKYIVPVLLTEGESDRTTTIRYIESLIKNSEFMEYTDKIEEFMAQFPGNKFTHTEAMQIYEQFGIWCLNKRLLDVYDYDLTDEFMLDRDSDDDSCYDKLQRMIGIETVKKQIDDIIALNVLAKERKCRFGKSCCPANMHMIFAGNPGTAKTTAARLFAGIAKEKGILKSGAFIERGGMDLDGLGCVFEIRNAFTAASGGVLFIDEAYSMKSGTAITVLLQEMENHRDDVIVILAGYNEKMNAFIEMNEGLKSRVPYWVNFPDYNADELTDIFKLMLDEKGFTADETVLKEVKYDFEKARCRDNFGNGRYVRNLVEKAIKNQSARLLKSGRKAHSISDEELFAINREDVIISKEARDEKRTAGTAQRELDEMIGLSSVKEVIRKAKASFKLKKICMDRGIHKGSASLHMVFTGNPGTAKTTVARLFAEILKDENVLPTGKFIEVGRAELVGETVGSTAPLVKKRFREARGGVLFIDEAYSLCDGCKNGFGEEAITTIVQEMENQRDNVIVIFAGYPEQMKHFLDANPGLSSRIAFHINFEDYNIDELCGITGHMILHRQMSITDEAMKKLQKHYEIAMKCEGYGNGRFVRKLLEEAEMNLAERIMRLNEAEISEKMLTTIEEVDIPEYRERREAKKNAIGFSIS